MLTSGLSESTSNEIIISDFEAEVVVAFVQFLYTDKVSESNLRKHAVSLLKMSHKYDVKGLFYACEIHLGSVVCKSNIGANLMLAETYGSIYLTDVCMYFVSNGDLPVYKQQTALGFDDETQKTVNFDECITYVTELIENKITVVLGSDPQTRYVALSAVSLLVVFGYCCCR
jgi:hypothetical protein